MSAQNKAVHPTLIGSGVFLGETPPLRDLPRLSPAEIKKLARKKERMEEKFELNEKLSQRSYPYSSSALPNGPDAVWQKSMPKSAAKGAAPVQNFAGQTSPYYPPDCNGAAGPNHFMQAINTTYAIYSKTGTLMAGPTAMNTLFSGLPGATYNDGDPIILYDDQAQRFLAVEFSISGTNDYMLVAVSTTSDPTGTWYKYSFDVADTPDYEKFGIWQDGYYMADNNSSGNDIYVFQRSVMLTGGASPQMIGFDNPNRPTSIDGFMCVPPVDNDGAFAPAGSPGTFIAFNDDAIAGGSDQLWIYELAANWVTPASSTFARVQQINVTAFDSNFGTGWDNISQSGTTQKVDAIPQVIMNVPQYRNFGTYQTIVCCHSVDVDGTDHAGVRWYELHRGTETSGGWTVRQQGTYAPDANSRWLGSIMLNGSGKIGLGYSISSSSTFPGIRYTGQSSAAYNSASGLMDVPEQIITTGAYSQSGQNRWGDYSQMSVDPSDDQTFWFTSEYIGSGGTRNTQIASFKIGNAPVATTLAATSITSVTATLNGIVNPNGLATTYYFEYGTTASYGSQTTVTSAGSGSADVVVSAPLSALTNITIYHFRLVAVNSDGTVNGNDFTFTTGGVSLTTSAVTSITTGTASSGGVITADGGFAVTARGVCWSTNANPAITGNHTSDGTGTGTFTSSLTGLFANTLYHVRAYATNANGTFYGNDITFTTLCGKITAFPWNEGFENTGNIPACWSQEQVASSGINWVFITGSGNGHPAAAHGGTYNACLSDASSADNKTKLITPSLDISAVTNPQLKFWHTQPVWTPDQDQLIVYYKTSTGGAWTVLATYTASLTAWTMETITLPSASSDYYIAFEGNAKYGYGVCVDDVSVSSACTLPSAAGTITGTATVCQGAISVGYTVPTISGATSYSWTYSGTGATITGTTNSVTITFTSNATSGNLAVYGVNTCGNGTVSANYPITVTPLPVAAGSISGTSSVCQGAPSIGYSVPAITNATSYVWSYTGTGATITGATNSITITFASNATSGNLSVYGTNSCGNGTISANFPITLNSAPFAAGTITGSASVCQGAMSVAYYVPVISGATGYVWAYSGTGATITGTTNNVTITFSASATSGNLTVYGTNTCGNGTISNSIPITINPLPLAAGAITGTSSVCQGATSITYSVGSITNATSYVWSYTGTGASITGTTNSVTITFASNATSGNLSVYGTNTCGNGTVSANYPITVAPMPVAAGTITGTASVCQGAASVSYSVPVITNATSYVWAYSGTGATINGTTNSITITFASNATSGNLNVYGTNSCGNGTISTNYPVTVNSLPASVIVSGGGTQCGSATLTATNSSDGIIYFQGNTTNGTSISTPSTSQVVSTTGTYYFRSQSSAGCWGPEGSTAVTINPSPNITSFTATPSVICAGSTADLSATATSSGGSFNASASSGSLSLAIPNGSNTGVTKALSITTGGGNIDANSNVQVTVSIAINRDSDIDMFLVGPGNCGTLLLSTDNGGNGANYTNTILSTSASNVIGSTGNNTAPFTGTYRPEGTLTTAPILTGAFSGSYSLPTASLTGCPVNGSWTLFVADDQAGTAGTLTKFDLTITGIAGTITHAFSGSGSIGTVNYSGAGNQTGTATVSNAPLGTNTYNVITTGPNGCTSTSTTTLTVYQPTVAAAQINASAIDVCVGTSITLTQSGGSLGTGAYWQWYTDAAYTNPVGGQISAADASLTISPTSSNTYYLRGEGATAPCSINVGDNTKSVTVTVHEQPFAGGLTKNPVGAVICEGQQVSVTAAAGTGGAGTVNDILEYRYDGGNWSAYTSGLALNTTGHISVDIRTYRTSTVTGCSTSSINEVGWIVSSPSNLGASNVTTVSADLSWTDVNGSSWNIEYGLQGYIQGSGTIINGITTQSYNLSGLAIGTNYSFYVQSDCGGPNSEWKGPFNFMTSDGLTKTLQVKLFLEGLYAGNGIMNQSLGLSGPQFGSGIADKVSIELHYATPPYSILYTYNNVDLSTNGMIEISSIPGNITGSYFIVVKHRSSIETWSVAPVDFGLTNPVFYNFTTSASKAYGNNEKLIMNLVYAIWGGDASQDGTVDATDMGIVDNAVTALLKGYYPEDVNGDGTVDASDMSLIDNNATNLIRVKKPE
ncbi:MAG: fibronectin type III domain-containing protein [Bacteroidota bacterium]